MEHFQLLPLFGGGNSSLPCRHVFVGRLLAGLCLSIVPFCQQLSQEIFIIVSFVNVDVCKFFLPCCAFSLLAIGRDE